MLSRALKFLSYAALLTSCAATTGVVQGKLCFPSEYVPALNVYLKSSDNNSIYKLASKENQQTFAFRKIPEGNYVAFAYTKEAAFLDPSNKKIKGSGGYTRFVTCGLSVNCKDHTLVTFKVNKRRTTESINICDWYGAIVPAEK